MIVTLIIAAIEIPVIYFLAKKDDPADAGTSAAKVLDKETTKEEKRAPITTLPPGQMEQPAQVNTPPVAVQQQVKDTQLPAKKEEPVAPPVVRETAPAKTQWTEERREEVLQKLNSYRDGLERDVHCVKVRQTANSNVADGFSIAGYLKQHGFIITGRETINKQVRGIEVTGSGDCLAVTIGIL